MYRNYKLNELRMENIGEEVILSGWVSKVRDLGHFTFIDLRDRYGITQILVNEEVSGKELLEEARKLKNEWVIKVTGKVAERSSKNKKKKGRKMKRIFISFCRSNDKNIIEKLIKNVTKSDFIHCEMIVGNTVYDYSENLNKDGKMKWYLPNRLETRTYLENRAEIFEINFPEGEFGKIQNFVEEYFEKNNYDKNMKVFTIGDFGFGNEKYVKGSFSKNMTICSNFCFEVLKYIVKNYYANNQKFNEKIDKIQKKYDEKREYITPGWLFEMGEMMGIWN